MTDISERIIAYTKAEILCHSSFLSVALNYMNFLPYDGIQSFSIKNNTIYYNNSFLIKTFSFDNGRTLSRYIIHCVFHFICKNAPAESDPVLQLSQDIMIEKIIDELFVFKTKDSFFDIKRCNNSYRRNVYAFIKKHSKISVDTRIYRLLTRKNTNMFDFFDKSSLISEFTFDIPLVINAKEKENKDIPRLSSKDVIITPEQAEKIARLIKLNLGILGENDISYLLDIKNRKQTDYKTFLRKFAVLTETMKEDNDIFDYSFYNYGNEYLDAPIIEPIEYSQAHTLDGFVIAIDTSSSCSVAKIKKFIQTACDIVKESLDISGYINVHIIQCDFKIRHISLIKTTSDLQKYINDFKVYGGGGTDFTPVFEHAIYNIKSVRGLVYFTDGNGVYPKSPPPFDTAFVFVENENIIDPPKWAKKIIINESDI